MNRHPRLHRYARCLLALAVALPLAATAQSGAHDHAAHPPAKPAKPAKTPKSAAVPASTHAADPAPAAAAADHAGMDHAGMNHEGMNHAGMSHGDTAAPPPPGAGAAAPREPIPTPTEADRAAAFPSLQRHMVHAPEFNHFVLFNRLEAVEADRGGAQAWEGQAWFGTDTDRLWLRSEGEREDGHTESANLEALYGRAISPWWDLVVGAKHDFRPQRSQTWAAIGVQGMSPYKFEVAATAYVGESGRTAVNLEAEYELLLTNRLILQPLVEVDLYGRDDPRRGVGSGLSTVEAGLRLRYEISRKFAPYIGLSRERAFGQTADYRREHGEGIDDTHWVAGVRVWF